MRTLALLLLVLLPTSLVRAADKLLRFPDVSRESIAFTYGGDLWTVPRAGGVARQLTTTEGLEWLPKFSPDGKWIAFTAQVDDADWDVYVIPAEGGEPRRLTWHPDSGHPNERMGPDDQVVCWSQDGTKVIFRSRRDQMGPWPGRLWAIPVDGGLEEPLPMPESGLASFAPDGKRLAYARTYRDFRTWKRYRGGMAQDIWIFDLASADVERITDWEGTDNFPMWHGEKIYFASDREGWMNLFSYDVKSKQTRRITNHDRFDVKFPSLGPDAIVYEYGGAIFLLDLANEQSHAVPIEVHSDRANVRPAWKSVSDRITSWALSPSAARAVVVARGDVFTLPAEKGEARNLTATPGADDRSANWSPDGKKIAWISDSTGEDEIWLAAADGSAPPERLTSDGNGARFAPIWSPDSTKILCADKNLRLVLVDVATKATTEVEHAKYGEITSYAWAPDSKWVTYAIAGENELSSVRIYSLDQKKSFAVTDAMTDSNSPVFDPSGKYLMFTSNRDLTPTLGQFELSFTYNKTTRIYVATLRADLPSPFAPESDEEKGKAEEKKKDEGHLDKTDLPKEPAEEKKTEPLKIDVDGIGSRIAVAPQPAANIFGLIPVEGKLLFVVASEDGGSSSLKVLDFDKRKVTTLLDGIDGYDVSADGKKVIYKSGATLGIVDVKTDPAKVGDGKIETGGLRAKIDPLVEWREVFDEAWRQERDFFYDPGMHGLDWPKVHDKYAELLPFAAHRTDVTYLIGEMIGELATSHSYVGGGEMKHVDRVGTGLLGIDWELDRASGRYRVKRVVDGQNWIDARRSPLTEPGVAVKAGEYVLAVDRRELRAPMNPYSAFEGTAGKAITLRVSAAASGEGARDVVVRPIGDESELRYFDLIETNRRKVDAMSNGAIGYVHIPNMGLEGLSEFVRQYFPQIRKQGLIVDDRYNGGGFVSQMILERLRRVVVGMSSSRNAGDSTYPEATFNGYMACLINEYSASDGDYFPYYFRKFGLGPLIGKRTWGGVVGIRGNQPLIDGGYVTRPEFAAFGADGWVIENHGTDPDLEIDNLPKSVIAGHDPQLEKAVELLLKQIADHPKELPKRPPYRRG
ncbi:MAG: PD40 domain-containing protein [Planctomycetes bacterium]|nr:PD40 domain-containing protein [Planctomycetota bacterium]MBI3847233.1 PD40 domain-containing protein [Planctomycetota bacterium]